MKKNGFITIFLIIVTAAVLPFTMFVTVELNSIETVKQHQIDEIDTIVKQIIFENLDGEKLSNGLLYMNSIEDVNHYIDKYANPKLGTIKATNFEFVNDVEKIELSMDSKANLNTILNSFKYKTVSYKNDFLVLWKEDFYNMNLTQKNFDEFDFKITNAIYPNFYNHTYNDFPLINKFGLFLLSDTNLEIGFEEKNGFDIIDYDLTFTSKNTKSELEISRQRSTLINVFLDESVFDVGEVDLSIDMNVGYWTTSTNADGETEDVYATKVVSYTIENFGYIKDSIQNRFYIKGGVTE